MSEFMQRAIELAKIAASNDEVPVGAVIVKDNKIIAEGFNQPIIMHDPTAHAEMMAMRAAGQKLENYRLNDCDLYVTLEPCAMCAAAMVHARIKTLYYAASDPKTGVASSCEEFFNKPFLNHRVQIEPGLLAAEASWLLKSFFQDRR